MLLASGLPAITGKSPSSLWVVILPTLRITRAGVQTLLVSALQLNLVVAAVIAIATIPAIAIVTILAVVTIDAVIAVLVPIASPITLVVTIAIIIAVLIPIAPPITLVVTIAIIAISSSCSLVPILAIAVDYQERKSKQQDRKQQPTSSMSVIR